MSRSSLNICRRKWRTETTIKVRVTSGKFCHGKRRTQVWAGPLTKFKLLMNLKVRHSTFLSCFSWRSAANFIARLHFSSNCGCYICGSTIQRGTTLIIAYIVKWAWGFWNLNNGFFKAQLRPVYIGKHNEWAKWCMAVMWNGTAEKPVAGTSESVRLFLLEADTYRWNQHNHGWSS